MDPDYIFPGTPPSFCCKAKRDRQREKKKKLVAHCGARFIKVVQRPLAISDIDVLGMEGKKKNEHASPCL